MKVKDLKDFLSKCNPSDEILIEDEKTKEVFSCAYVDYDYFHPKKENERKKVFLGVSYKHDTNAL